MVGAFSRFNSSSVICKAGSKSPSAPRMIFLVALIIDLVLQDGLGPAEAGRRTQIELAFEWFFDGP